MWPVCSPESDLPVPFAARCSVTTPVLPDLFSETRRSVPCVAAASLGLHGRGKTHDTTVARSVPRTAVSLISIVLEFFPISPKGNQP